MYACSAVHNREHQDARAMPYTNENTLFNNELKTEMTTIIPLANRARCATPVKVIKIRIIKVPTRYLGVYLRAHQRCMTSHHSIQPLPFMTS